VDLGSLGVLLQQFAGIQRPYPEDSHCAISSEELLPVAIKILMGVQSSDNRTELRSVVGTTIQMLAAGFFRCLHDVVGYVLHIERVFLHCYQFVNMLLNLQFFSNSKSSYEGLVGQLTKSCNEAKSRMMVSCDCEAGDDDSYIAHNINAGDFKRVGESQHKYPYSTELWRDTSTQQTNIARSTSSGAQPVMSRCVKNVNDLEPY
jgi:hypothetical protein